MSSMTSHLSPPCFSAWDHESPRPAYVIDQTSSTVYMGRLACPSISRLTVRDSDLYSSILAYAVQFEPSRHAKHGISIVVVTPSTKLVIRHKQLFLEDGLMITILVYPFELLEKQTFTFRGRQPRKYDYFCSARLEQVAMYHTR